MTRMTKAEALAPTESLHAFQDPAGVADGDPGVSPSDEEVRRRAHEVYLARNGGQGDAMSDWLTAERELRRQRRMDEERGEVQPEEEE